MDMAALRRRHYNPRFGRPLGGRLANPFAPSENGSRWLKGNLHAHTTNSDGLASPAERVAGYAARGYDFLCLSDHLTITRPEELSPPAGFCLIPGAELHPDNPFGGQVHHFLALNLKEDLDSVHLPPQEVIDRARAQGASVWFCHPHWSSAVMSRDALPLRGLAGLEVFNATSLACGRELSGVQWDDWLSQGERLYPALAVDDSHGPGRGRDDVYLGWTMVHARENTPAAIVAALEAGSFYATTGPELRGVGFRRVDDPKDGLQVVEATVACSEACRVVGVGETYGGGCHEPRGRTFERATFTLAPNTRWVRLEIHAPDGTRAWSNPFDLTALRR